MTSLTGLLLFALVHMVEPKGMMMMSPKGGGMKTKSVKQTNITCFCEPKASKTSGNSTKSN